MTLNPLTNYDINGLIAPLGIKHFRGVFMKDELPQHTNDIECGIVNLQNSDDVGSHWVGYYKANKDKFYFDSYGNAKPPLELVKYLGSNNLYYNLDPIQQLNDPPICGHLCLLLLQALSNGESFSIVTFKKLRERVLKQAF